MSQIVGHTEINEHLGEIAKNIIVEHLFYTIFIAISNRTPAIFSTALIVKCAILTKLTIRDTRVLEGMAIIVMWWCLRPEMIIMFSRRLTIWDLIRYKDVILQA